MLAWVNAPEYLAAFLENKNEGFGGKGQKTVKFWFMVTGRKNTAYKTLFRNLGPSSKQSLRMRREGEKRIAAH